MAKEFIERETALEKVIEVRHYDPELNGVVLHRYIKEIDLKDIPAADVVPVVHGRWEYIPQTLNTLSQLRCPFCGWWSLDPSIDGAYNYCPNCGEKMDKEETNELD